MFFEKSIKKILLERGYKHCESDEEFTRHGDYARNIQYAFSKEFADHHQRVVDIIFLSVDMHSEKVVIGFFRENVSIENGILENSDVSIPLAKFSMEEFEKKLDRLIPRGSPIRKHGDADNTF
jgi:hypothetical protein